MIETEDVDEAIETGAIGTGPASCKNKKRENQFTFKVMKEYTDDGEIVKAKKRAEEEKLLKEKLEH